MDPATALSVALTGIGVLLGTVISIGTTIVIERTRRPHLRIELAGSSEGNPRGIGQVKFLHLQVINEAAPKLMRWMARQTATDCWGTITFHREDGQLISTRVLQIRWPRSPEPVPPQFVIEGVGRGVILDLGRLLIAERETIPAGERAPLNVAARFGDENDC